MSVDCGIAVGRAGVPVCRVGALAERGARRLSWPVMTAIDPLILGLLVGGALLVGVVALWRGGRFSARLGEHSIRAGTGPQIRGIQAGRDAKLQVIDRAPATIEEVTAGRDVEIEARRRP